MAEKAKANGVYDPDIDPNTKYEGWIHYPDNVKRQIVESYEEWTKRNDGKPFVFEEESL